MAFKSTDFKCHLLILQVLNVKYQMNKSLENCQEDNLIKAKKKFVNIIEYLNELFQESPISLYSTKELSVIDLESFIPLRPLVFMDDKIIEDNLRMIESYMPEILFAFSIVSNNNETLNGLIQKLCKKKFPYTKTLFSKFFLQHKIVTLLETILFADIFNGVWNGEIKADICYVNKEHSEIRFYHYFEVRQLLIELLDRISIKTTINDGSENEKNCRRITFRIVK